MSPVFGYRKSSTRRYVEAELDRTVRAIPGWHAEYRPPRWQLSATASDRRNKHDFWVITEASQNGWYLLEIDAGAEEFLIWFGMYQAGATPFVWWILEPAVHIRFDQLDMRTEPSAHHLAAVDASSLATFRLGDVLSFVVIDEGVATMHVGRRTEMWGHVRYPKNYVSLT